MIERRQNHNTPTCYAPSSALPPVLVLEGKPESASQAREFARRSVRDHVPDASEDHIDTVVLVVSELVTNSIRYGTRLGGLMHLTLDADGTRTRVEVLDSASEQPAPRPESEQDIEHGRGLIILDALCPDWGVIKKPTGKCVWAEVKAR
ncbi:MAG TPA: ATP-binding protein [Streptomyces sp.]